MRSIENPTEAIAKGITCTVGLSPMISSLFEYIYIYIIRLSRVSLPYKAAPASGPAMYMPQAQPQPGNAKDQSEWDLFWGWWFPLINTASYSFWCVWCVSIGHSPNSKPVLSIHLSIYQSINLSTYPSICLSYPTLSYPILYPFLSYPIYIYLSIYIWLRVKM